MTTHSPADPVLHELLTRATQQDERIRRLESSLLALARLPDGNPPPTSACLVDTQRNSSNATPKTNPWPDRRTPTPEPRREAAPPRSGHAAVLSLVDGAGEALVGLDAAGLVRSWSAKAARLFGWSAAEVIGRPPPFVPPELAAEHDAMRQRNTQVRDVDTVRERKTGQRIAVRVSTQATETGVLFAFGPTAASGWAGAAEGAGDHSRDTEQYEESDEDFVRLLVSDPGENPTALVEPEPEPPVDSSLRGIVTLGRAVAGVIHDLNNVLSGLQGYSELLCEQLPPTDARRHLADGLIEATDLAAGMTRQLLTLVRPSPGLVAKADVNHTVQRLERLLRSIAGGQHTLAITLGTTVTAAAVSAPELSQVLLNLVQNARDAMLRGGTITVRTATQLVGADRPGWPTHLPPGEYAVLTVVDQGAGMDADTRRRVFDPFFTTKGPAGGSGIGLMTVRDIVARCGGHIEIESSPEWGTHVRVFFPKG